jgi:hypothetical protein
MHIDAYASLINWGESRREGQLLTRPRKLCCAATVPISVYACAWDRDAKNNWIWYTFPQVSAASGETYNARVTPAHACRRLQTKLRFGNELDYVLAFSDTLNLARERLEWLDLVLQYTETNWHNCHVGVADPKSCLILAFRSDWTVQFYGIT